MDAITLNTPDGSRVECAFDDGTRKEGVLEWDNCTAIIHFDDGTTAAYAF